MPREGWEKIGCSEGTRGAICVERGLEVLDEIGVMFGVKEGIRTIIRSYFDEIDENVLILRL